MATEAIQARPPGSSRVTPAHLVIAGLVAAIAILGAISVMRFPVWAIDEAAHYSYVQYIAEDHRLPVLRQDYVSPEVMAILQKTYPAPAHDNARAIGLFGLSYEGFQPPLYYIVSAPVFAVVGDYHKKIRLLRAFDLMLLMASIGIFWRLTRRVFGEDWTLPFVAGLAVFLWPGFIARGVTISNAALALPLALLFIHELWRADTERTWRHLWAASVLLGLCLLTRLTLSFLALPLAVVVARLVWAQRSRVTIAKGVLVLVLPVVFLVPWMTFSLDHYDALTPNKVGVAIQDKVANPTGKQYSASELPRRNWGLLNAFLPEEWKSLKCDGRGKPGSFTLGASAAAPTCHYETYQTSLMSLNASVLKLVLFALPLLSLLLAWRLALTREFLFLVVPLLLSVAVIDWALVASNWSLFYPRHAYPMVPPFALFAVIAWRRLPGVSKATWVPAALAGVMVLSAAAFWADRWIRVGHL